MPTADDVVTRFRRKHQSCDTTRAFAYLNEVLYELCRLIRLYPDTETINLTASTREYALDSDIAKVYTAVYHTSSASRRALQSIDVSDWDYKNPTWRDQGNGTVTRYYLDRSNTTSLGERVIGFDKIPSTTTSGGYPKVVLQVSRYRTLVTGSPPTANTNIPEALASQDVLVYGMDYRYTVDEYPEDEGKIQAAKKRYDEALIKEVGTAWGTDRFNRPTIHPAWMDQSW